MRYLIRSRHGTTLYVRVIVPASLQQLLGRTEFRRSLGDLPPRLARLRAAEIGARLAACFAQLMDAKKKPARAEMGLVIEQILRGVDGTLTLKGVQVDPANHEADIVALNGILGSSPAANAPTPLATPKLPYTDLVAAYVAEHVSGKVWSLKTRQEAEAIVVRYGDQCSAKSVDPYSKEGAVAFKKFCVDTLAARTANKHITRMLSLFTWGIDNGYCATNPFSGLKPKKARGSSVARDERDAWSDEDIKILLAALSVADEPRGWLALLGCYTGARINELCQLYLDDIKVDKQCGIAYLDINASRADQKLKNAGSARFVPLHGAVLDAGFAGHVETLRKAGEKRLFPDFKHARDGYGQAGSRWFGRLRDKLGLTGDFHGLRHTIATKLREASVEETTVNELLGHSYGRSMSYARYAKAQSLSKLSEALQKLKYS